MHTLYSVYIFLDFSTKESIVRILFCRNMYVTTSLFITLYCCIDKSYIYSWCPTLFYVIEFNYSYSYTILFFSSLRSHIYQCKTKRERERERERERIKRKKPYTVVPLHNVAQYHVQKGEEVVLVVVLQ